MNLNKLFDKQRELDARILLEKGLVGQDLLDKKILALQVELGELANEWRGFKFWSNDQKARMWYERECHACRGKGEFVVSVYGPEKEVCGYCDGTGYEEQKNPLLEEYVDCLHFILSIGLEYQFDQWLEIITIEPIKLRGITEQFSMLMKTDWDFYEGGDGGYYHEGVELFLGLGEMLGFSWEEIEQAYFDKNAINHQRQEQGY